MNNSDIPTGSLKTYRLFPLPGLVLFPHAVLPLHIFEPRYRQMTEDALASDNLITMVQSKPLASSTSGRIEPVPIEEVGCLGKIMRYERLPDGRFNLLLLGLSRLRLRAEVPSQKLYRIASADVIEEVHESDSESPARSMLLNLIRSQVEDCRGIDPGLQGFLDSDTITLGALADIVAHSLDIPPQVKQALLEEREVERRIKMLLQCMGEPPGYLRSIPWTMFPPSFSLN